MTNGIDIGASGHEFQDSFEKAVNAYLKSRKFYLDQIKLAELYAEVMATEYYVCAGIGFTKYLN